MLPCNLPSAASSVTCAGIFFMIYGIIMYCVSDWNGVDTKPAGILYMIAGAVSIVAGLTGQCFSGQKVCLVITVALGGLGAAFWTYVVVQRSISTSDNMDKFSGFQ